MDQWELREGKSEHAKEDAQEKKQQQRQEGGDKAQEGSDKPIFRREEDAQMTKFAIAALLAHVLSPSGDLAAVPESKDDTSVPREKRLEWRLKLLTNVLQAMEMTASQATLEAVTTGEIDMDCYKLLDAILQQGNLEKNNMLSLVLAQAIKDGIYDARVRACVARFAIELNISKTTLRRHEAVVASALEDALHEGADEVESERKRQLARAKRNRYLKIGIGTVVGGTLIGVTGGLAAPLVAAGAGAVFGTSAAVSLGSVAGIYAIGSLFGAYGARMGAYRMSRRDGQLEEFKFLPMQEQPDALTVTICVSGWVTNEDDKYKDYVEPWLGLNIETEQYCLLFDYKQMLALGVALEKLLKSQAIGYVMSEVLKRTVLASLMAAVALPAAILKIGSLVDNPWSVAANRAERAGVELANALLSRAQGNRPVTLVGYSLGALSIFHCLKEMARRKHARGIVEKAFLFGAPVTGDPAVWAPLAELVSSRLVVGHSKNDWLLAFLCRGTAFSSSVAGVHGVASPHVENLDLSDIIQGRTNYAGNMDRILVRAGLRRREYGGPHRGSIGSRVYVPNFGYGIHRFYGMLRLPGEKAGAAQVQQQQQQQKQEERQQQQQKQKQQQQPSSAQQKKKASGIDRKSQGKSQGKSSFLGGLFGSSSSPAPSSSTSSSRGAGKGADTGAGAKGKQGERTEDAMVDMNELDDALAALSAEAKAKEAKEAKEKQQQQEKKKGAAAGGDEDDGAFKIMRAQQQPCGVADMDIATAIETEAKIQGGAGLAADAEEEGEEEEEADTAAAQAESDLSVKNVTDKGVIYGTGAVAGGLVRRAKQLASKGDTGKVPLTWIGVAFDEAVAANNGTVKGVTYFRTCERHGGFFSARSGRVRLADDPRSAGKCYSCLCMRNRFQTCYSPTCLAAYDRGMTVRKYEPPPPEEEEEEQQGSNVVSRTYHNVGKKLSRWTHTALWGKEDSSNERNAQKKKDEKGAGGLNVDDDDDGDDDGGKQTSTA